MMHRLNETANITWSHWIVVAPSAQQSHDSHPSPLARFQCPGAQLSHDKPTTLGLQGHWPVEGLQGPAAESVPNSLQLQATKERKLLSLVRNYEWPQERIIMHLR